MTTLYGFDGASAFDLAACVEHNGILASAYIVGNPGGMPHADKTRVDAIRAAGMGALPNWERAANFFATCSNSDAKNAGVEALAAARVCGFPDDGSIGVAFSFDFQVPTGRFGEMRDKLAYAGDGMGGHYQPLGYGQSALIDYWAAHGISGPHWLMGSTWGLPYHPGSPNVALVQSHDAAGNWLNSPVPGTDINTVTNPDRLPAWWPDGSPYGGNMPTVEEIWGYRITVDNQTPATTWTAAHVLQRAYTQAQSALDANAALAAQVKTLQAQVAALQTGGVDPVTLAKAIADHIDLAAK